MNFCRPVQQICKKLCPKQTSKKYMPPVNTKNGKQENYGQENLNRNEENKSSYHESPKKLTQTKQKKTTESFDDSLYDYFPEFNIRHGNNIGKKSLSVRSSSTESAYNELLQRKRRKGNSIFGPPNQPFLKKSGSLESNVKNKTSVPKNRRKQLSDPVKNQWANKGAIVYSAQTDNPSNPKPNKYWVQTELQYIILLPMDKHKTKSPSPPEVEPEPKPEALPNLREKESFGDLGSFSSDDSFVPRSQAKPAPKPKGRFCCAKRQESSSSD